MMGAPGAPVTWLRKPLSVAGMYTPPRSQMVSPGFTEEGCEPLGDPKAVSKFHGCAIEPSPPGVPFGAAKWSVACALPANANRTNTAIHNLKIDIELPPAIATRGSDANLNFMRSGS